MMHPLDFILEYKRADIPTAVMAQMKMSLLDSLGIAMGGRVTPLSRIIYTFAQDCLGGDIPLPWGDARTNAAGYALALATTTDALDGHDGFNLAKGHIGCSVYTALLAVAQDQNLCPSPPGGAAFLDALAIGYEVGARVSVAQHGTVADFHTSGSWGAVAAAAAIARLIKLDRATLREALGIAEYHGPRSQMMRCLDHPTMVKDGSGIGAMTAVMSVKLARLGYTGAPAITVEEAPQFWGDLGQRWYGLEQYYKPFPVCRYAHAPVEAALDLRERHHIDPTSIANLRIETFHESLRLATIHPKTTEEAQYSTAFPVALALAFGEILPWHLLDQTLQDPDVHRLASTIEIVEDDMANAAFPAKRFARMHITLKDGTSVQSDWHEPRWDATSPPAHSELIEKYRQISIPLIGEEASQRLEQSVLSLDRENASLTALFDALHSASMDVTAAGKSL